MADSPTITPPSESRVGECRVLSASTFQCACAQTSDTKTPDAVSLHFISSSGRPSLSSKSSSIALDSPTGSSDGHRNSRTLAQGDQRYPKNSQNLPRPSVPQSRASRFQI